MDEWGRGGWDDETDPGPGTGAQALGGGRPATRSRSKVLTAAGLAGLVLLAGVAGGGIALALAGGQAPSGTGAAGLGPAGTGPAGTGRAPVSGVSASQLDVAAIARHIDPGVVDITSRLGYQQGSAAGTGMVLTPGGQVLTNNHVIAGATSITARVTGAGRTYTAKVLGVDPSDDIALLQLQGASGMATVPLGQSSAVRVGQPVVAIGNALDLQGPPTVTQGMVSALDRTITAGDSTGASEQLQGVIQTDAPLAPGNSGGPLVGGAGQVIGMNTAASSATTGGSGAAIGFAIPIDRARAIVGDIRAGRAVSGVQLGTRPLLGVEVQGVGAAGGDGFGPGGGYGGYGGYGSTGQAAPVSSGALVVGVEPGSPADAAGISAGDVIVSLGGRSVASADGLSQAISGHHPGDAVPVTWVDQSGQHHSATVHLASGPPA